jgi:iron complex outermembrane recepter protein
MNALTSPGRRTLIPLLFVFISFAGNSLIAQTGSISGTVTDIDGNPVPYANITLLDTFLGAAARADGAYAIENVPAGTYTIRASAVGFRSRTTAVTVNEDETVSQNFRLESDILQMDAVVVSGTPGGAGVRKRDASFAITTMEAADIQQFSPTSTANLLELVPGVWSESSGGVAGANIFVRGLPAPGDAPFVTMSINGAPIYGTQTLSFFEQSSIFRIDETIESSEALRGGPNSVFSSGEPGLTANFNLKRGSQATRGRLKYTASDYNKQRIDAVLSGHIVDNLYYMVGGYARTSPGVRDAQFNAENGQQITVQLTKHFDRGVLNAFTRVTDDHGQWVLPMALNTGNDLGTFTQLGNATRFRELQINQQGDTEIFDFAQGRGWKGSVSGLNANFDLGAGWVVRNNLSFTQGEANTFGFVPDGNPIQASVLAGELGVANIQTRGGAQLAGTEWVQSYGHWVVLKDLEAIANDLSISSRWQGHDVTVGVYQARWSSRDFWSLGNFIPVHNVANGDRLQTDISCNDLADAGAGAGCWAYGLQSGGDARTFALYAADSWQILPMLRVDLGLRYEWFDLQYSLDEGPGFPDGTINRVESLDGRDWAITAALNYDFSPAFGVFGRFSDSFLFPHFDNIRENLYSLDGDGRLNTSSFTQYEFGVKYDTRLISLFATGFLNNVDVFDFDVGSVLDPATLNTETIGVEIDAALNYRDLTLRAIGTYQSGEIKDSDDQTVIGNDIWRQPDWQIRFAPSYNLAIGSVSSTLYGALRAVGKRWDSRTNVFQLDGYTKLDLGVTVTTPGGLSFNVHADNLTDSDGLTEGDPRDPLAANGRPIFGRSVRFSIAYDI